jgi:diacylglycerol kinase family enzyme
MTARITVIVNVGARLAAKEEHPAERVAAAFDGAGAQPEIKLAADAKQLTELTSSAVRDGSDVVVAAGGDGTVSTIASALVGNKAALGILPMGTMNHLARDLGIPKELDEAARVIVEGRVSQIDVAEVNGRIFVNNSSLGLYPELVDYRQRLQRFGQNKWMAFAGAAVAVFRRYPFVDVRLEVEGKELVRKTPLLFVGNNVYQIEGLTLGRRPRLDGGCLWLYVTHRVGRLGLLGLGLGALLGLLRPGQFDSITTQTLTVESHHRQLRVATDGEVSLMETPLRYNLRPLALRVVVPAPAET